MIITNLNKRNNNPFDLEQAYAKVVRRLVQKNECPITLSDIEAKKQILAFVDRPYSKRQASSIDKALFVSVIFDPNEEVNTKYINKQNKAGGFKSKSIEAVFTLQFRISKSTKGIRDVGGQKFTDVRVLDNIVNFARHGLTLNNNNQDLNTVSLENVEYGGVNYGFNLKLSNVISETGIQDEGSLTGGDQYQYYVKNITIKTIIIIN